jgi:UDP:flavonoid glycosyltransferase YjiC (YdhE family)
LEVDRSIINPQMKTLLFGLLGWNIAETTRMLELARHLSPFYACHFVTYGGMFVHLVKEAGYRVHTLQPIETAEKIQHIWRINRGEHFKQPWSVDELIQRVEGEMALIETLKPSFIVLGFVLSLSYSARLTKRPLVHLTPLPLARLYLEANFPHYPNAPFVMRWLVARAVMQLPILLSNFRAVAKHYGLKPPRSFFDVWNGDVNLLSEVPGLSLIDALPSGWHFVGPWFAHLKRPIPPQIETILAQSAQPKLYFAMGSSGSLAVMRVILRALSDVPIQVIAPIQSYLEAEDKIPANVHVCDWLPALEVCKRVDFGLVHGGQGTLQTLAYAGKPFIGIGMQAEQDLNVLVYQRAGSAIRLQKRGLNEVKVRAALVAMMTNQSFATCAIEVQSRLQAFDKVNALMNALKDLD